MENIRDRFRSSACFDEPTNEHALKVVRRQIDAETGE